jgi:hypothetical protein
LHGEEKIMTRFVALLPIALFSLVVSLATGGTTRAADLWSSWTNKAVAPCGGVAAREAEPTAAQPVSVGDLASGDGPVLISPSNANLRPAPPAAPAVLAEGFTRGGRDIFNPLVELVAGRTQRRESPAERTWR